MKVYSGSGSFSKSGLALVAVIVTALVAASCGSSKTANPPANSTSSPSTAALTAAPILFGVISTDSGASGQTNDAPETITRWSSYINSHGGINGHPVKVYEENDNDNSAIAVQDANDLIQNKHVIAIGDNSFVDESIAPIADKAKIPVISLGGNNASPTYLSDPNYFTNGAQILSAIWGFAELANLAKTPKLALAYCSEIAACSEAVGILKSDATALGVSLVYSAGFSGSQPSYAALCLAAKDAGAEAFVPDGPVAAANQRLFDNCAQQGYHPVLIGSSSIVSPSGYKDSAISDIWEFSLQIPWFVKDPATATFDQVMGSYLPHAYSDPIVMSIWSGLEEMATAAQGVGATPTSADIYNGLYGFHNETVGGLTVPLTFTAGKPGLANCLFIFESKGGQLSTPIGTKTACENPDKTATISAGT